jgi:hypothetical protein
MGGFIAPQVEAAGKDWKTVVALQRSSRLRASSQLEKREECWRNCAGEMASSRSESTSEETETADLERSAGESPSPLFSLQL